MILSNEASFTGNEKVDEEVPLLLIIIFLERTGAYRDRSMCESGMNNVAKGCVSRAKVRNRAASQISGLTLFIQDGDRIHHKHTTTRISKL